MSGYVQFLGLDKSSIFIYIGVMRFLKNYPKSTLVGTGILIASIILAVIFYVVIIATHEQIFSFLPGFWLCLVTFMLGGGIFISGHLKEKENKKQPPLQ